VHILDFGTNWVQSRDEGSLINDILCNITKNNFKLAAIENILTFHRTEDPQALNIKPPLEPYWLIIW